MARLLMLCCSLCLPVLAQAQADPLRPPPGFITGAAASASASGEAALQLQSVLLAPGRQIALIGGRTVAVGERIGDYRLLSLTERRAVLQGPQGRLLLYLIEQSTPPAGVRVLAPPVPGGVKK